MAYDPSPDIPPTSKYLSFIPVDRLNKAPVITINNFSNEQVNSVSVRLADFFRDEGAGNSVKAGVKIDDEKAPDESKWAKYYDPQTVNEAPIISIYSSVDDLPYTKWGVSIIQTVVPTRLDEGRKLLGDVPPNPDSYKEYIPNTNMAPDITVSLGATDEQSNVTVDMNTQFTSEAAVEAIFAQFRR
ncbi:unnamed protein product [Chondrus crispus]|uniref:Uncharacterized protein n=1 Tax=Chondrus crispus TaxID=2769 RepID=R7QTD9_CHOCR|nr:unnamed protein product [Chondrus crispus]CDF40776.1 unnamed protein product [Chondrus crispus]|eukprot:XP_005711070.1 unnamed protein product [Chondrus crispus]